MSKNNPSKRTKLKAKEFQGKKVVPARYVGTSLGHGVYMAVQFDESKDLAFDKDKKPLHWDAV